VEFTNTTADSIDTGFAVDIKKGKTEGSGVAREYCNAQHLTTLERREDYV
jgi:hypothetical protein